MRSIETQGNSVEEATSAALQELGVSSDDVDVEVLHEPRRGLFSRGKATVRVTVREGRITTPPSALPEMPGEEGEAAVAEPPGPIAGTEDSDTEKGRGMTEGEIQSDVATEETEQPVDVSTLTPEERIQLLDEECELAADFVEGLLDLLDLPGDIEIEVSEDGAVVNVSDVGSGLLIGRRGATLDALQELVRSSTQRQTERRSQVRVDVEGYRARQLEKLRSKCRDAIAQVRESGEPFKLEPMDSYERKMMHDLVARTGGVTSTSEGAEPKRRVVILPE